MADRFVDDGGDNTNGLTWGTAYTSLLALESAEASFLTTSGNRVIFGAAHNDATSYSADKTFTLPSSGLPVIFISSTEDTGASTTITPALGTGRQIDTSNNGANTYGLVLDGAVALIGMRIRSGANISISVDANESSALYKVTFLPGHNGITNLPATTNCRVYDLTVDCTSDSGTAINDVFQSFPASEVEKVTILNASNRTGQIVQSSAFHVAGLDVSSCTGSGMDVFTAIGGSGSCQGRNVKTPGTYNAFDVPSSSYMSRCMVTNMGSTFDEGAMAYVDHSMEMFSSSVYRTGGAEIEGVAGSWYITRTTAYNSELAYSVSPWIVGDVASTGSKTFTVCIANNTQNYDNDEVWLEIEYYPTAGSPLSDLASNARQATSIVATPTTHAADASTWSNSPTYKQKLEVTATIGQAGKYRARVCCGITSGSSLDIYIDPRVIVT